MNNSGLWQMGLALVTESLHILFLIVRNVEKYVSYVVTAY
jgi:hypothetical protein